MWSCQVDPFQGTDERIGDWSYHRNKAYTHVHTDRHIYIHMDKSIHQPTTYVVNTFYLSICLLTFINITYLQFPNKARFILTLTSLSCTITEQPKTLTIA